MRMWKLGLLSLAAVATLVYSYRSASVVTSIKKKVRNEWTAATFDAAHSAGLFVGITEFDDNSVLPVPYAVDDAVDLAYVVAIEKGARLVSANRVVLALSGQPVKEESQRRLQALLDGGARRVEATQANILVELKQQAAAVGKRGILVASFATHGYTIDGVQYLLAKTSVLSEPITAVPAAKVLDLTAFSKRSLLFIDACRERVSGGATRSVGGDPMSAAPLMQALTKASGQAVFYAAAAGGWAHDDDERRNGVFTAAVLDGLQCQAKKNQDRFITVENLGAFVEEKVRKWILRNRPGAIEAATQLTVDGTARTMPLACCNCPGLNPRKATAADRGINAYDKRGKFLWRGEVDGTVVDVQVASLDGDKMNEVVVAAGPGGKDSGKIVVFDADGNRLWDGEAGGGVIKAMVIGDLLPGKEQQIVALATNAADPMKSQVSVFRNDGELHGVYPHPGALQHVLIGQETARHDRMIIVAGTNDPYRKSSLFLLDPEKLGEGEQRWYGVLKEGLAVARIGLEDPDHNGIRDIAVESPGLDKFHLNFKGEELEPRNFFSKISLSPRP